MSYTTTPDADALKNFLSAAGIDVTGSVDWDLENAAALDWWHDVTGWNPFLKEGSETSVYYTPPDSGTRLDLSTGFVSISEVLTAVATDGTGGDTRTANEEWMPVYWKEETQEGWITALDMYWGWGSGWRSIKITGYRGCQENLDPRVYRALLCRAALTAYGQITGNMGRVQQIKQGPVTRVYETGRDNFNLGALGSIVSGWDEYAMEVALAYTRSLV